MKWASVSVTTKQKFQLLYLNVSYSNLMLEELRFKNKQLSCIQAKNTKTHG